MNELIELPDEHIDPEIAAIAQIAACMATLDEEAQDRVAGWVFDRYRIDIEPPQ